MNYYGQAGFRVWLGWLGWSGTAGYCWVCGGLRWADQEPSHNSARA